MALVAHVDASCVTMDNVQARIVQAQTLLEFPALFAIQPLTAL
jgi:hypothetical protein